MSTHMLMPPLELEPLVGPVRDLIRIEARTEPYVAGRSAQCDVVISDPDGVVSRRHCEFRSRAEGWMIT
ncbi:MAG: FHA domain-containing protein, partial [Phycisphaerales bacterium]